MNNNIIRFDTPPLYQDETNLILYVCNTVSSRGIAGKREWSNCPGQHGQRGS
jgi:hypothetical protein